MRGSESGGGAAEDRVFGGHVERFAGGRRAERLPAGRRRNAGDAPGEGGLAHAAGAGEHPGVMQAAGGEGIEEGALGGFLAVEAAVSRGCGAPSTRSGSGGRGSSPV